jgi:hypothetical protein
MYSIELRTNDNTDCDFVHVASTVDNAVAWIKKYGLEWYDKPYFFAVYDIVVDADRPCHIADHLLFIDKHGNIFQDSKAEE